MKLSICKWLIKVVTAALISFMTLYGLTALAAHDAPVISGIIELDANLVDRNTFDEPEPDDDWDTLAGEGVNGSNPFIFPQGPNLLVTTGRIMDPDNPGAKSYFKTGSSKDIQDISIWNGTGNSAPPKDRILNAGAAAYSIGGDLILAFFLDRYAQTGSSTAGFWFTKIGVSFDEGTSTFSGSHSIGDILVIADFSQGGAIGTVRILEWVGDNNGDDDDLTPPGAGNGNGPLQLRFEDETFSDGMEGVLACDDDETVCAIVNGDQQFAWDDYQSKTLAQGLYPSGSFLEGAINVTALLPQGTGCFAGFVAETRASDEVNSTLKDFVVRSFPVCGIEVSKACVEPAAVDTRDFVTVLSTYDVTINSKGPGTIFDIVLQETATLNTESAAKLATDDDGKEQCLITHIDTNPVGPFNIPAAGYAVAPTLSGSTVIRIQCDTFDNPFLNQVKVLAGSADGLSDLNDTASDSCDALKPNPAIGLAKKCDGVNLVPPNIGGAGGAYSILVNNTVTLSVPVGAKEALIDPIVTDDKMTNLTEDTTQGSNSVTCLQDGSDDHKVNCTGLLKPGDSVVLTGTWTPQGNAIVTLPSTLVFQNTANASGIGSISFTQKDATPATANCGLCDEDKDGVPDVDDGDTCPIN